MQLRWIFGSSLVALVFVSADLGCNSSKNVTSGTGGVGGVSSTNAGPGSTGNGTQSSTTGGFATSGTGGGTTNGTAATTGMGGAGVTTTGMGGAGSTTATATVSATTATSTVTTATTGVGTTSSTTSTGAVMTCPPPPTLHPPPMGNNTIYCPFAPAAGQYCDPSTQHCCEPAMGASACDPSNMMCPAGDNDWKCQDPVADCNGKKCCANAAAMVVQETVNGMPCASDFIAVGMTGTSCLASCNGAVQLCTNNSECPNGMMCRAFRHAGAEIGQCI